MFRPNQTQRPQPALTATTRYVPIRRNRKRRAIARNGDVVRATWF